MNALELEAQYFKDSVFQLGKNVGVRIEAKSDEPFWAFVFKTALPHQIRPIRNVYSNIVILLNHIEENFKNQIILETENRLDKNTQMQSIFREFKNANES